MAHEPQPNRYQSLKDAHRQVAEDEEKRRVAEETQRQRDIGGPEHDPDTPEGKIEAKQKALAEQVSNKRIDAREATYQLRRYENELEMQFRQNRPSTGKDGAEGATRTEKEASNARPAAGVEMTESRMRRLERLRSIQRDLEEQRLQREADGNSASRPAAGRTR